MPRKKNTEETVAQTTVISKLPKFPARPTIHRVNEVLSTLFYIVWLIIGLFFLLVIFGQIRQGALSSIVAKPSQQSNVPQVEAPTETALPGVGKVNIACVQQSLDSTAIQKIITDGNASKLTAEEKSKLEPCIVEAQSPSPSASPAK